MMDGPVAMLPGTSRRSHSLQSGVGGLRWPGRYCLLPSARSVWAVHTHTHTQNHQGVEVHVDTYLDHLELHFGVYLNSTVLYHTLQTISGMLLEHNVMQLR